MPNGTDCCCLLQTEHRCVPTQWLVFDVTEDGRAAEWFQSDLQRTIDYVWLRGLDPIPAPQSDDRLKQALIRLRPTALKAMFDTYSSRREAGSGGRLMLWLIGDLAEPLSRLLLAELPLDLSNAIFWETRSAPGVLRAGFGANVDDRREYLWMLREQYFTLPEFSTPYYGKHQPGQLYGSDFDSSLLAPDDASLRAIVEHLVVLHVEEAAFALRHTEPARTSGGIFVIEHVLKSSRRWRKIDWLAVAQYPYFARLWDTQNDDILDVLDYSRCPDRAKDPWAALRGRLRERDWDHLNLPGHTHDLMYLEEPYRITPGDFRTRLPLATFLVRHHQFDAVLEQARRASQEAQGELEPRWLKLEGMARRGLGQEEDGRDLLARYRDALLAQPEPSAGTFDEVASVALMQSDWDQAVENALRAIEEDACLLHAYDTLVIVARKTRQPQFEEQAKTLAARNGVKIPLLVREEVQRVMAGAKVIPVEDRPAKKWWQFWRR